MNLINEIKVSIKKEMKVLDKDFYKSKTAQEGILILANKQGLRRALELINNVINSDKNESKKIKKD